MLPEKALLQGITEDQSGQEKSINKPCASLISVYMTTDAEQGSHIIRFLPAKLLILLH